jgi:hypothetical protein
MNMTVEATSGRLAFQEIHSSDEWNRLLEAFDAANLYNSWGWGEYKRRLGWKVQRVVIRDAHRETPVGLFQLQRKDKLSFRVSLIQGGVCIRGDEAFCANVLSQLREHCCGSAWRDVVLINYFAEPDEIHFRALLATGFTPVISKPLYTLTLDTSDVRSHYQSGLSGNWRHNLKRGQKNPELAVSWAHGPDERLAAVDRLEGMYLGLGARKGFALSVSIDRIRDIVVNDPRFLICQATYRGEVVAVRIGYRCHGYVTDFLAASGEGAKNNYANYVLVWSLISRCEELGLARFECGGIDPSGNVGVYNFKKGLGGRLLMLGPLWIFSRSRILSLAARLFLAG